MNANIYNQKAWIDRFIYREPADAADEARVAKIVDMIPGDVTTVLDAGVGGSFKMSFENFSTGNGHSFGGEYLELVPNELIRYTDKFDDPNLPGEMQTTVSLKAVSCGTDLTIVQEGLPEAIPLEACNLGWQESLMQLATLVEPDIPG